MNKPSIPSGMRDFSPAEVQRRQYIFSTIRNVFKKYGYQPIETPTMENLSTLEGKYGEEGDKLLFRIMESGEVPQKKINERLININKRIGGELNDQANWQEKLNEILQQQEDEIAKQDLKQEITDIHFFQNTLRFLINEINKDFRGENEKISAIDKSLVEKGLRYDLTVPFARYVVMHQNEITFPFKRYQIQPVFRADRPQRGRYREFFQCDADVVGSDSLVNEMELIRIYDDVFSKLGMDVTIKINNRKVLSGMAEVIGATDRFTDITVAIDKLDKVGLQGVRQELTNKGLRESQLQVIEKFFALGGNEKNKLDAAAELLKNSETGMKGIAELRQIFSYLEMSGPLQSKIETDFTLARGLNYYTGAIIEVKPNNIKMGSVGGGGRYDDLTGVFGLKGVSGVGISFGADRIYDVMEELKLFPENAASETKLLFVHFDEDSMHYSLPLAQQARREGIATEIYPSSEKIKKQLKYADDKKIPFVILIGEDERKTGKLTLKNMVTGNQENIGMENIIAAIKQSIKDEDHTSGK
jgi:histidyl-tRNA synthetase